MTDIGRRIVVYLNNGATVEGWDFGSSPLGQYVALDRDASDIRFLPNGTYGSRSYSYDDLADIESIVHTSYESSRRPVEVDSELSKAIRLALDRTDFNEIRRLSNAFEELRGRFHGSYDQFALSNTEDNFEGRNAAETVIEARIRYVHLLHEVERSGFLAILVKHAEVIRNSPLPYFERRYFRESDEGLLLETMYLNARMNPTALDESGGKEVLDGVRIDVLVETLSRPTPARPEQEPKSKLPKRLRVIAAAGKMVVGGGLATANLGVGVVAGVLGAIPTLGLGAIAGAVGVATSAYTGFNAACDGIKDLAAALEGK